MPKAQVLVTVTAEALIEVPADVADVEGYCREHVAMTWGGLQVERLVQSPSVTIDHFAVREPEPEPTVEEHVEEHAEEQPAEAFEPVAEAAFAVVAEPVESLHAEPAAESVAVAADEAGMLVAEAEPSAQPGDLLDLFSDPVYQSLIRKAVRERAERLLEAVINEVVVEFEPLLRRHLGKPSHGAW